MLNDEDEQRERATLYRQNAKTLRRLAAEIRFDFCRRHQLFALAAGFDRLAERQEGSPLKHAAN